MQKFAIAIHGGAGTIVKEEMTPAIESSYRQGLQDALDVGYAVLAAGGHAIDAAKAAVMSLEDNPLFNAGRGSVFTKDGSHEMDAAIMNGEDLSAGAVAGIKNVCNPIELANAVRTETHHVLLSGHGAMDLAQRLQLKTADDDYFFSQHRYNQWQAIKDTHAIQLDHTSEADLAMHRNKKMGTVGAVACDATGNIAAATSTGGMTNKLPGRIGDSPLIGAGTYANNRTCAVSCTGHGEIFMKAVAAYDVSALMEYKQLTLEEACHEVVKNKLVKMQGEGGLVAIDAKGNTCLCFNSPGMYRGMKNSDGENLVAIYG